MEASTYSHIAMHIFKPRHKANLTYTIPSFLPHKSCSCTVKSP